MNEQISLERIASIRERLGPVGAQASQLWSGPVAECRAAARRIEQLGYGSLWLGELVGGKDAYVNCAILLGATNSIIIGTGIANIWARAPGTAQGAAAGLEAAWPGRFINGLGVSHPFAAKAGGQSYGKPLEQMRQYLKAMDESVTQTPLPLGPEAAIFVPRMIGAIGPKMIELARDETIGAMPRFMTTDYTRVLRAILGPNKILAPEQAIVLEPDPQKARAIGRRFTSFYVGLDNYRRLLKAMGFTDEDYENGGSDKLVDAIVAWGSAETVARRIKEHLDAGADHVQIHPQGPDVASLVSQLEEIAPFVIGK